MKTIFRVCLFSILIMAIFINIVNADNELIYKISGQSMSPTLIDGDYVSVTAKDSYKENDIVIAKNRLNQDYIIKRIKIEFKIKFLQPRVTSSISSKMPKSPFCFSLSSNFILSFPYIKFTNMITSMMFF